MTHPSWDRSPPSSETTEGEHRSQPSAWAGSPMPSLYEICLGIQRHLGMIEGRQEAEASETRRHLNQQDAALYEIKSRVTELERRPQVKIIDPLTPVQNIWVRVAVEVRSYLRAIASLREWVVYGTIAILAVRGVINPETLQKLLLVAIGPPLK